jgi:NtrC-family two-component system sensor histidine kinase KinB
MFQLDSMMGALWLVTMIAAGVLGYLLARPLTARRVAAEQKRRIEQLAVLNQVGQALGSSLRLDELLETIYRQVSRLIDATHYYVALYDAAADTISFPLARQNGQVWQIDSRRTGNGLTEYVIRTRQPLLITRNVARRVEEMGLEPVGQPTRSWMGVPMLSGDQVVGVIAVQNTERESVYDQEHLDLLQTVAAQAAAAVANARLYERTDLALARRVEELGGRNRQLREFLRLGNVLRSSFQLQDLLDRIVQAVVDSGGFNIALLNLVEPGPPPVVRRVASAGLPGEVWEQLRATTVPLDQYTAVMRPEFLVSRSYLIGHQHQQVWASVPSYVPDLGPRTEGEWTSSDALLVPLIDSTGQLMGMLSVDDPLDRHVPAREVIEVIEVFANQAAVAIESARLFHRLAEGHDRLQAILESTRDGLIMVDMDGRIVVVNTVIRELFGVTSKHLVARRLMDLVLELPARMSAHAELIQVIYSALRDLVDQSATIGKGTVRLSDPHRVIDWLSAPVLDVNRGPIGRLLVLHNVTEERDAEMLRQDLTDMIVHDLRSPLTSILLSLDVLQDTVGNRPEDQPLVAVARSGSTRLLKLVNSLLDISKFEAGQMPLNLQPMSWAWLTQTGRERVGIFADKANVALNVTIGEDAPDVEADGEVILRVLLNLLDNAIHFSPAGMNVDVSVSLAADRRAVECRIVDRGPGIPADYRARIFEKFVQVPEVRQHRGTGLGLAFSRLAIEAHGGRLWFQETPGGGSTFVFALPIVKRDAKA